MAFVQIIEFHTADIDSAAANSSLPETQAAAEQYMKVSDGPPVLYDLDILEDQA